MQLKTLILTGLLGVLTACAPMQLPTVEPTITPTPSETAMAVSEATATPTLVPSETPTPTRAPSETPTPEPTATPTPAPTEAVWEIWFRGFSCEGFSECGIGPGSKLYNYMVDSDGSDLRQITMEPDFAHKPPTLPQTAPQPIDQAINYQPSSDGRYLPYVGTDRQFYLFDFQNMQTHIVYDAREPQFTFVGPYCWRSNDTEVVFLVHERDAGNAPSLYVFSILNFETQHIFDFNTLDRLGNLSCSPKGTEIVVALDYIEYEKAGLYIINTYTGSVRQILRGYYVGRVSHFSSKNP